MSTFNRKTKFLASLVLMVVTLAPLSVSANPVYSPIENLRQMIVFGLICLYIVLIEGTILKLMLFGLDGITWPKAILMALVLNLLSGIVGLVSGVYFDTYRFEFEPGPLAVFSISLLVEGSFLVLAFAWRKRLRALLTAVAMNIATYTIMILSRFPNGI